MAQYGTWIPYSGYEAYGLAVTLLIICIVLAYYGKKLPHPLKVKTPGKAVIVYIIVFWLLSLVTFLFNFLAYVVQLVQKQMINIPPRDPISPVTYICVVITFIFVVTLTRKHGTMLALLSGVIAALVAPMLFELPFDLIIVSRTFPPIPPAPIIFRGLFFLPLFCIEVSTLSLLLLTPLMRVTRYTLFSLAGMFFIFALWALFGFKFPADPVSITCNVIAKLLAFVAAITLFVPQKIPNPKRT